MHYFVIPNKGWRGRHILPQPHAGLDFRVESLILKTLAPFDPAIITVKHMVTQLHGGRITHPNIAAADAEGAHAGWRTRHKFEN
jgi:hypothetical protein